MEFDYALFTQRNLGFVSAAEQAALRNANVFICGVGGMGGACLMSLVRAGLGGAAFADFDRFEISNLNRQLFADLDSVGSGKTEATATRLSRINPEMRLEPLGADWVSRLDELLPRCDLIVNGMDDLRQGVALYRAARRHRLPVIDAYMAPLPSVYVTKPGEPTPEERLAYPSVGRDWQTLDAEALKSCVESEIAYVMTHSSSAAHVDLALAAEVAAGKRPRMSLAPMVITTGNLMAFEALRLLLKRPGGPGPRGYFFNPWTAEVEKPLNPLSAALKGWLVRRFMKGHFRA